MYSHVVYSVTSSSSSSSGQRELRGKVNVCDKKGTYFTVQPVTSKEA
jgi:hypothetical protein